MGRPKGSKNSGIRKAARTPYQTYSDWYDKYTKGYKEGWFAPKYNQADFEEQYNLAKLAKLRNPARAVAQSQEYVDRTFEKRYKELYGKALPDIRNVSDREKLFLDYVDEMRAQGKDYDEARDEFEKYFY